MKSMFDEPITITLRIDRSTKDMLEAHAKRKGTSLSSFLRESAMEKMIEQEKFFAFTKYMEGDRINEKSK
jgi:uncharacterized protein (DUF1778 family)